MRKLELNVGGLNINPKSLRSIDYLGTHNFIVKVERDKHSKLTDSFSIYVADKRKDSGGLHCEYVMERFKILKGVVAGGDLFVDENDNLVFYNGGGELHGGTPKALITGFGKLMIPGLKKKGINIKDIVPLDSHPDDNGDFGVEWDLSPFWINAGYFTTKPLVEFH